MKKSFAFFLVCLFAIQSFSQIKPENPDPFLFRPFTHSSNFKSSENKSPAKSFYQSKSEWQTIIDTTWGPGLPLNEKLAIFDAYTWTLTAKFGGFNSLGIDPTEWDSIKASYRARIDSSTSRGAFAAMMGRMAYNLRDLHDHAWDTTVLFTPLNPGIPVLAIGNIITNHFGAVLTVLPDSSLLVLRVINNHPLGLQPGDIVLGYEGVPWKDLVDELLGSGIPIISWSRGAKSAMRYHELASAGMNWHLFETIDIVKYPGGDTVHLPVYPLSTLPVPPNETEWYKPKNIMWCNEQLPVPGVPFPDPDKFFSEKSVTYGIVEGTNIGYIYLYAEVNNYFGFNYDSGDQLYEAVKSLSGTDGLIVDMRLDFGGSPKLLDRAFNFLSNMTQPTLSLATRCNQTDFSLCSSADKNWLIIHGNPMSWYDRPLAILTGPNCVSAGDFTAYRFKYHPMSRFFGKSTCASFSDSKGIGVYPGWMLSYSWIDSYSVNDPGVFLCRREFPVDDSVWFDAESAANGKDAVAQKAMDWIRNLTYVHNVSVNPTCVIPLTGKATLTAKVENPNDHNLSVSALITSMDSVITDTIPLFDDGFHNDGAPIDGTWGTLWPVPANETIFAAEITAKDSTAGTSRSTTGAAKFTSIGPVVVDRITYYAGYDSIPNSGDQLWFKVSLRNNGLTASAVKVSAKVTSLEPSLAETSVYSMNFADIVPGQISTSPSVWSIKISKDCPPGTVIPVKVEISSDFCPFWADTISFTVSGTTNIEDLNKLSTRIYPNPTDDIINIEIDNTGEQEINIELLTVSGQLIYRKDYKNNDGSFVKQIDLSGYSKGIYFLRIRQSGKVYNGKIIIM